MSIRRYVLPAAALLASLLPAGASPAAAQEMSLEDCPQYNVCIYAEHNWQGRPWTYIVPAGKECQNTREGRSVYNTTGVSIRVWEFSNCTGRSEYIAGWDGKGNATTFSYDGFNYAY